ncbi:hypothetical protein FE257_003578 [Aspergillus nanangensis]|uniref:Peptidase A1 domain-containing protein n=1 Tax=Aspergillus nanangensis TaxID=2582783 RepID=A0AAD4GW65_ASPNN|nr:hypothetical protein FE257_003578 [Aspergillus nanangensis]
MAQLMHLPALLAALLPATAQMIPTVYSDNPVVLSAKLSQGPPPSLQKRDTVHATAFNERSYWMNISIGTPPQPVAMLVDTLSTSFTVMYPEDEHANCSDNHSCTQMGYFDPNSSSTFVGSEKYFDESFRGYDAVTVGEATLSNTSLALVTINDPYVYNAIGLSPDVLSFPYRLVNNNLINTPSFSIWKSPNATNEGEILFGGINTAKFHPPLHAFPFEDIISLPVRGIELQLDPRTASNASNSTLTSTFPVATYPLYSRYITTRLPLDTTLSIYTAFDIPAYQREDGYWPTPELPCPRRDENHTITFFIGDSAIPISWTEFISESYNDPTTCMFQISPSDDDEDAWPGVLGSPFVSNVYLAVDYNSMMAGIAQVNDSPGPDEILEMGTSSPQIPSAVGDFPASVTAYKPTPTETFATETSKGLAVMRTAAPGLVAGFAGVVAFAMEQPSATAICAWDGELSYGQLDELSTGLAHHLLARGVCPDTVVPLCFEKSMWMPVAVLAVTKAGGVSVSMDANQPEERLRTIIDQTLPVMILCSDASHEKAGQLGACPTVPVGQRLLSELKFPERGATLPMIDPSQRLYITFTSGSTGIPTRAIVTHSNVSSALVQQQEALLFGPHVRVFDFMSYACDVQRREAIEKTMSQMRVNYTTLTPSVARQLNPAAVPPLDTLALTGETLSQADIVRWAPHTKKILHTYGPSHCLGCVTVSRIPLDTVSAPTLVVGSACNTWIVDPDNANHLVSIGAIGELWVEGPLIGPGYLGLPLRTAESFVSNPRWLLSGSAGRPGRGGRLYRTGDLVRYAPDGALVYIGRKDSQVKIRGQRWETSSTTSARGSRASRLLPTT